MRRGPGPLRQHLPRHGPPQQLILRPDKPRAAAIGERAEEAAREHLLARGLSLVGANVRIGRLEIDLVLRDGPVIVIVEVRSRAPGSWQRALDSVDKRKQLRIRTAGERLWRDRFARDPTIDRMRFDIAAVTFAPDGSPTVEHIKAAF